MINWNVVAEPGRFYVYRLLDSNQHIIYVGMTMHPKDRLRDHLRNKDGIARMIVMFSFDNVYDCALKEFDEINRLSPRLNGYSFREAHANKALLQMQGIDVARAKGSYTGRAKALTPEQVKDIKAQILLGIPKAKIARDFGVSRQTLYTAIKEASDGA